MKPFKILVLLLFTTALILSFTYTRADIVQRKVPSVPIEPGMPTLSVRENEVLLAVIHGYGPTGWRDAQATQTYLLKNAVGSGLKMQPGTEFAAARSCLECKAT